MEAPCLLLQSDIGWSHRAPPAAVAAAVAPGAPFSLQPLQLGAANMRPDMNGEHQAQAVGLGLGLGPSGSLGQGSGSPSAGSTGSGQAFVGQSRDQLRLELSPSRGMAARSGMKERQDATSASPKNGADGEGGDNAAVGKSGSSRYESQKKRDWNTFGQYLKNHRPPIAMSNCTAQHVLEFLSYLDQFGKTKVHEEGCRFFGSPGSNPCGCPMKQAWGSLDSLVGRLRAAYEENGGTPDANPFAQRVVRVHLREVKEAQAKARGVDYEKRKRRRRGAAGSQDEGKGREALDAGEVEQKKLKSAPLMPLPSPEVSPHDNLSASLLWAAQGGGNQVMQPQQQQQQQHQQLQHEGLRLNPAGALQGSTLLGPLQTAQAASTQRFTPLSTPAPSTGSLLGHLTQGQGGADQVQVEQQLLLELLKQQQALALAGRSDPSSQALLDALLKRALGRGLNQLAPSL